MWSLWYMGPSWWCGWAVGKRTCERERPAWGCWGKDREARTLAAAEAVLLGGTKWRFHPGKPDAVSTGWASTLANRLSGCKGQWPTHTTK